MPFKDRKPRSIKAPLNLLPVNAMAVVAGAYSNPKDHSLELPSYESLPYQGLCAAVSGLHDGNVKYTPWNFLEKTKDAKEAYTGACIRHLLAYAHGETDAPDSGVNHLSHAASGVFIMIEQLDIRVELCSGVWPYDGSDRVGLALKHLFTYNHPLFPDSCDKTGLHHLAVVGRLLLDELEETGVDYQKSVAVQAAEANTAAPGAPSDVINPQPPSNQELPTSFANTVLNTTSRMGFLSHVAQKEQPPA